MKYTAVAFALLCLLLAAVLVPAINKNTLTTQDLNDNHRYFQAMINNDVTQYGLYLLLPITALGETGFFITLNLVFYLAIGAFFLFYTKDKTITLLVLLCFSTTLVTTFSLYAQALLIIVAMVYWIKVEFSWNKGNVWNILKWAAFALFAMSVHRYGILIWLCVFAAKVVPARIPRKAVASAYVLVALLLLFGGVNSGSRLGFYYPTLLPVDLGQLNTVLWLAFLSVPIIYTFIKTEKSENTKRFLFFTYLGTFVFYLFVTHLEIDIWRMMILADLIMLYEIAKVRADKPLDPDDREQLLDWVPIVLILFGLARVILGMRLL